MILMTTYRVQCSLMNYQDRVNFYPVRMRKGEVIGSSYSACMCKVKVISFVCLSVTTKITGSQDLGI